MHIYNEWLLERSEVEFDLPKDFFDSPLKLFVFCGNVKITHLVENDDMASFDFHTLIFAATFLMIDDKYLFAILNSSYVSSFKENNTILPCLFSLLTLEIDLPLSLQWFESKFPNYDKHYVDGIKHMMYVEFRRRMLNFARHSECFERHFYIDFLGRAHYRKTCQICIKKDKLVQDKVTKVLEFCIDLDSDSDSSDDLDIEHDTGLFITNYNHKCSSLCCSRLHFVSNINKANLRDFHVYTYYQNLASDQNIYLKIVIEVTMTFTNRF